MEAEGGEGASPDLELVFDAAIAAADPLAAALRGATLPAYVPEEHLIAKEANR